jgi:hypothetical protein
LIFPLVHRNPQYLNRIEEQEGYPTCRTPCSDVRASKWNRLWNERTFSCSSEQSPN